MLQRFQRELSGENKIIGVCTFIDPRTGLDLRASGYPTADAVGAVNQHVQHAVHEAFIVLDGPIPPADPVPAGQAPGGAAVGGSSDFWERAAAVELSPYQRRQLKVVDEVKAYLGSITKRMLGVVVLNAPYAGVVMGRIFNKLMPIQAQFFTNRERWQAEAARMYARHPQAK